MLIRFLALSLIALALTASPASAGPLKFLGKYTGVVAAGKAVGKAAVAVGKFVY